MKNVKITSKAKIVNDCFEKYGRHLNDLVLDFLDLRTVNGYFETDKYYFFKCQMIGLKEVRFHKESKRVSVSSVFTKGTIVKQL